jgi:hypothetical protein
MSHLRRQRPEATIQKAVIAHLRARGAPGVFACHVPNGGFRRPIEAAILKGMGVVPGTPDIIAIYQGRVYAMELKASGGRATAAQLACISALDRTGAFTHIAEGLDAAIGWLESYGLLRGNRQ